MPIRPGGTICCSFHGRTQNQIWRMITGTGNNNVYICNERIELCSEILKEKLEGQKGASSPSLAGTRLLKPKEIKSFLDKCVIGQDETKKVLSAVVHNHHRRVTSCQNMDVDVQRSNILMVGPTGSGKTYLAQTLAKILSVLFATVDTVAPTGTDYVGEDVENTLLKLIQFADYDISRAEHDIIYIDEIDKTTERLENVFITRDVSGEGVQQVLLKILERTIAGVLSQEGREHSHQEFLQIDITNILFICGDALDGLEGIVEQHLNTDSIGFNAEIINKGDTNIDDLLRKVESRDSAKFDLIPEFIGHVPVVVSLRQLTKDVMAWIFSEPKNALTRQYQKLFELDNVELEFARGALEEVTRLAVDREIGARGLRFILESAMMDLMYEILSDDTTGIRTITREVVKKVGQPEPAYRNMPSASARKPLSSRVRGGSKAGEIA